MAKPGLEGVLFSMLQGLGNAVGAERVVAVAGQVLKSAVQAKAAVDDNLPRVAATSVEWLPGVRRSGRGRLCAESPRTERRPGHS